MEKSKRGQWSGQLGFVLAASGAAIGLGNIWKFPYMVGANGGSAFVIVYLICILVIGLPMMAAEILVGKRARANPVDAITINSKESNRTIYWSIFGWWGIAGLVLTLSFYSVVAGWSIYYFFLTVSGAFNNATPHSVINLWSSFMADPIKMIIFNAIFMFLTLWVVAKGVQKGLEKGSKIMMPLLFAVLIFLVIYASFAGNTIEALHYLFDFNFQKINGSVIINAMGHAFFTLAIGVGAMSIYGSYMPKPLSIGQSISIAAVLDVIVALLSGVAIYSLIFKYNLDPSSGPGLMFVSLPMAFAHMPFGQYIGGLFFILLFFAAWTSSINIAEPIIGTILEKTKFSRIEICWIIGIITWLFGLLSVFSFNIWANDKLFGGFTPFDLITDSVTNIILPIGGIFYAIFTGWIMKKKFTKEELNFRSNWLYIIWLYLIRFIAPTSVFIILIYAFI
ncbi:MAG: NSS family neurotransmitter:Na+ symporter [Francisellaceae bacterium]|jgi:NSS family neurotransmitter:Na+ symporter